MRKLKQLHIKFLDWQMKVRTDIAFWLLGWKNIKKLNVEYTPDHYAIVSLEMDTKGKIHTSLSLTTAKENGVTKNLRQ
jgi:hypothetical protein